MTNRNDSKETPRSELLRHYYLESMGVQRWQLFPQAVTADEHSPVNTMPSLQPTVSDLPALLEAISVCEKCAYANNKTPAVAGEGNHAARLMLVVLFPHSSAEILPDAEKTLLSKMLKAIDIDMNDVFITPLLKCPQAADCTVTAVDVQTCSSYIKQQIALIQPTMLFVLGEMTAQCLLNTIDSLDDLRARDNVCLQLPTMISYSPNDLLRQPANKKKAWADLQRLQKSLG